MIAPVAVAGVFSVISSTFTLKHLEALVWVARLGSFRAAAEHLHTTQPNISARINALETTLGARLMERQGGNVRLTATGKQAVEDAQAVLRAGEVLVERAGRRDLHCETLRLGVTELVACTWLRAFLRAFGAAYPNVPVELTVDLSIALDRALAAHQLDLTIQTHPFASPIAGQIELGACPYVWVAPRAIAQALGNTADFSDLLRYPILTHARHTQAYRALEARCAGEEGRARLISSNSTASCVHLAAEGMGVALVPSDLVSAQEYQAGLSRLSVSWLPEPLQFAARYHRGQAALPVEAAAQLARRFCPWYARAPALASREQGA